MSVAETYTPVLLTGDASETNFDFAFSVFANTDLVVALVDPDTLEATAQTLGVDYTVTLNTSTVGGTIVFGTAPADGTLVSIRRSIPATQGTDIPSSGLFREKQIENALDRAILLIQQLQEQVDRALLQNPYTTALDIIFPAPEASKLIAWNAAGDALENTDGTPGPQGPPGPAFIDKASQAEAEAGAEDTHYMTPLKTKQAIDYQVDALTGTAAGDIVKLDGSAKLPAVDGSQLTNLPVSGLTEDTTVNFTAAMTAAEIQALIDAQPKNLNGFNLTFQFADGTYTLDAPLKFMGYEAWGTVYVKGNTSENANSLHTNQAVVLNFSATDGLRFFNSATIIQVSNIKAVVPASSYCFMVYNCSSVTIGGCYAVGANTSTGYGFSCQYSRVFLSYNYVTNFYVGISASVLSRVMSYANDDTGTMPTFGLYSDGASTLGKAISQPSGSTANESVVQGGVIR